MGRTIPMVEITSTHPTLSLALFVVWMGALVALVSSLCGIWSKKPSESSSTNDDKGTADETTDSPSASPAHPQASGSDDAGDEMSKTLPPPPSATILELGDNHNLGDKKRKPHIDKSLSSLQPYISKHTSKKKLASSISMRMPMKLKDKASEIKGKAVEIRDDIGHHTGLKHQEDSLWTKRIMIGEKCRLHSDDGGNALLDDEIKNRILTKSRSHIPGGAGTSHSLDRDSILTAKLEETSSKDKFKGKEIKSDTDN